MIPDAEAISMTAVLVSFKMQYFAVTGVPKGPLTVVVIISPSALSARASTVPSPPSAKGFTVTSASALRRQIASLTAFPA